MFNSKSISLFVRYGDIVPITPVGRIIACLCGLCGATTIGMLVSILVDRYQRVYARKLYINEDAIDFNDFSDDDNSDADSKDDLDHLRRHSNMRETKNPNTLARINAAFRSDDQDNETETKDVSLVSYRPTVHGNLFDRDNNSIRFIIGYVDNEEREISRDLLETIYSVVARKQTADSSIELSIISGEPHQSSSYDVKFAISLSSDEDMADDDDDDDDELTEIVSGYGSNGNFKNSNICHH